jgi:hypothetical protein
MPLTTAKDKTKMALTLLKDRAKELFHLANLTKMSENAEKKSSTCLSSGVVFAFLIMDALACNYFPMEHAYRRQV